ncbi:MAG: DUF971 domain-containing protein [Planctomycetota bacterium]
METARPTKVDLKRDERLLLRWSDQSETTLPIALLRRMCPCANCKIARDGVDPHRLMRPATPEEMGEKPKRKRVSLGVVPDKLVSNDDVQVERAELVGNYAIKLFFSDGHDSGIYTWKYLHELGTSTNQRSAKA